MAEASGADEQRDDWNDHWDRYAESASLNPAQTMRHELILDALRSGGARIPTARLLDVGSGQGDFLVRANQSGLANEYAGFELSASGIRIARSSGVAALDKAAVDSVQRAAPFAKIPEGAGKSSWAFNVPIVFN